MPYFEGLQDETIKQGSVFDLTEGVRAFDGDDQEITYTYSPTNDEFDTCAVGSHTIQYHASQTADKMLPNMCIPGGLALTTPSYCDDYESTTVKRIIRIIRASAPQILGIPHVTIPKNTTLDVLNGVSAVDDNGNPITDISYSGTLDKQASGDIVSISDGDNKYPVKSLKVTLEPIQSGSGTPSPDNVRPISGHTEVDTYRTGINVWDEEWEVGRIGWSGQNDDGNRDKIRSKNYIPCLPNTTYYAKTPASIQLFYYDDNKAFISYEATSKVNVAFTTPSDASYMRFFVYASTYGTTYNHDISINYPSTDHEYHAYQGTTYTTDLGRTVYGGTLDVVSGELTVDRAMVDLGTLNWTMSTTGTYKRFYSSSIASHIKPPATPTTIPNIVSSQYEAVDFTTAYRAMVNGVASITDATSGARGNINVVDDAYSDTASFKTAMNGVQLVYELATPQTIQLTPQQVMLLHGTNNVWSDGEVTMVYSIEIPTDGEVSYPLEGEYEITYSATDKCGNVGEAIRQITVE